MRWYTILNLGSAEYTFFLLGSADIAYGYCSFLKILPRADCIRNAGILKFTVRPPQMRTRHTSFCMGTPARQHCVEFNQYLLTLSTHAQRGLLQSSVCVHLSVSRNSPLERLFVLKLLSRTQREIKDKNFVGISLKPLRCRDTPFPALQGTAATFGALFRRQSLPRVLKWLRLNVNVASFFLPIYFPLT